MINVSNLTKVYQMGEVAVEALRGVNMTINAGEYAAILGPSGSGKSTLMQILGCLDTPTDGNYLLNNREVSGLKRNELAEIRNTQIGFIFQSFNLLAHATALENVELPLIYRGTSGRQRREVAASLLERVGLSDRMDHKPNELSGGQRQRVAVARALAGDPNLILADEPTGNLDTRSGDEIVALFEDLVSEGKSVIVVTHDNDIAERAHRVVRIRDGLIESDTRQAA